jgi:hypothetical protein
MEDKIKELETEKAGNDQKIGLAQKRMQELEHLINGQKWDIARWTKANMEIDKQIQLLKG